VLQAELVVHLEPLVPMVLEWKLQTTTLALRQVVVVVVDEFYLELAVLVVHLLLFQVILVEQVAVVELLITVISMASMRLL
jgi:hypothetical protein